MLLRQRRANMPLSDTRYEDAESPFVLSLADGAPTPEQTVAANELSAALSKRFQISGRTCEPSFYSANFRGSRTRKPLNVSV
jgi:hypothetical protein